MDFAEWKRLFNKSLILHWNIGVADLQLSDEEIEALRAENENPNECAIGLKIKLDFDAE